jgi:hypothetical protein
MVFDLSTVFTKDKERRTEDSYKGSGFKRKKELSLFLGLRKSAPSCEAGFAASWRVILGCLSDTNFFPQRTAGLPANMHSHLRTL